VAIVLPSCGGRQPGDGRPTAASDAAGRSAVPDVCDPGVLRRLLQQYGLAPRRSLGQNFLVDRGVLQRIAAAAELNPADTVLEVGPGLGALTLTLAGRVHRVVAVEVDRGLCRFLRTEILPHTPGVQLHEGDVLEAPLAALLQAASRDAPLGAARKAVANLPYSVTGPALNRLLATGLGLDLLVLMLQQEVVRRLLAPPGSRDYGMLTVMAGFYAAIEPVTRVSPEAFYPRPQVASAVVRLKPHPRPPVDVPPDRLLRVARAALGYRRKTLQGALAAAGIADKPGVAAALEAAGLDPRCRGETLGLDEFAALARALGDRLPSDGSG